MAILRFLAYTNIWIACSAMAFLYLTAVEAGTNPNLPLLLFVGGGTFAAYFLMRLPATKAIPAPDDAAVVIWQRNMHAALQWPAYLAMTLVVLLVIQFPEKARIAALVAGALAMSYSVALPKRNGQPRGLRNVPGIKLFVIAATWTLVTYVVPLFYWEQHISVFGLVARISMVATLALLFDIRDAHEDQPFIRTVPQRWGAKKARLVAYVFVAIALVCLFCMTSIAHHFTWAQFVVMWAVLEIKSLLIYQTRNPQPDLFYVFGVEGLPILMALLVAFFT